MGARWNWEAVCKNGHQYGNFSGGADDCYECGEAPVVVFDGDDASEQAQTWRKRKEARKKVLVCGDRDWQYYEVVNGCLGDLCNVLGYDVVIHGDARGADRMAGQAAEHLGMEVIAVPAEWDKHHKAAGPIRNRKMLDMKPALVVAFHNDLAKSRGTKDCVTEARRRGIPVVLVTHTETLLP